MPTEYTNINTSTTTDALGADVVKAAWDRALRWELTDMPIYRQFVDVHPIDPTNNYKTVTIKKANYFTPGNRDLDEVSDGDAVSAPETTDVPVTLVERGMRTERTFQLDQVAYLQIDPAIAHALAKDAADTHDYLVRDVLAAGTNVAISDDSGDWASGDADDVTANGLLTARTVRRAVRALKRRNALPLRGEHYVAVVSPEQATDLREEVGNSSWRDPHANVDTANIYNGEIGTFEGAIFLETNRVPEADNATDVPVQTAMFLGREAVAEAVRKDISVGISPVLDAYNRHRGIFWHSFMGFAMFRQEAAQLLLTSYSD